MVWFNIIAMAAVGVAGAVVGFLNETEKEKARRNTRVKTTGRYELDLEEVNDQLVVGIGYYSGAGVNKDYVKAVEWFTKSAHGGNTTAQYYLGVCYFQGQGVAQNLSVAKQWLEKSRAGGCSKAVEFWQEHEIWKY